MAGEILVRRSRKCQTYSEKNGKPYFSFYAVPANSTWYWLRTPNKAESEEQPEFDYPVITNSLGIRDVEPPLAKAENEFRILALGDSFTEGVGAEYEYTYPKRLERILNDNCAPLPVRIINGGVSGSDPFYSYTLLRYKLLPYKPDLVTLAINASDVTDIIARGGDERFLDDGHVRFAKPPRDEWLFARSHLYRFIVMNLLGYDWFGLSASEQIAKREQAVDELGVIAEKFKALAARNDFSLLVILQPANQHEAVEQKYSFDADKLKSRLKQNQIDYVDQMQAFADKARMGMGEMLRFYWERNMHNTAAGYRILAENLADYIVGLRLNCQSPAIPRAQQP